MGKWHLWLAVILGPARTPRSHFVCPADELQTHSRTLPIPCLRTPHFILLDLNSVSVTAALSVIQLSCMLEWQCLIFLYQQMLPTLVCFAPVAELLEQDTFLNNLILLLPVSFSFSVLQPITTSVYTSPYFKILPPQPHPRWHPAVCLTQTVWGVRAQGLPAPLWGEAPSSRPHHRTQLIPSARLLEPL